MSRAGWLRTTEVDCLPLPEARSLTSRCWQSRALSETLRGDASLLRPSVWWFPASLGVLCLVAASLQSLPCVSESKFPSSEDTSHGLGLTLNNYDLILT